MKTMKRVILIAFLFAGTVCYSQKSDPIKWTYSSKKISDNTYELYMTATLSYGWHVYSQKQSKDAIAPPTVIKFKKNPLVSIDGKVKESGKVEKKTEPVTDVEVWQYSTQVDFIQTVKLKARVKTNLTGTIEYMVCTDERCLPVKTISFNVKLE